MRSESRQALIEIHRLRPKQTIWAWAKENVDFSMVPSYDTPIHAPYDPDFAPFLKEPVEALQDSEVEEIWIRKPSRGACSENVILNPIRYGVAVEPCPMLYLSSDQESTERFFDKRIKDGLRCSTVTAQRLAEARELEHTIYFRDMDLVAWWPKAKGAFKQSGYKRIFVDEASLLENTAPDMVRKRTDTYSNSKIVFISSPDPRQKRSSDEDPIFYETDGTDCRKWHVKDPKSGKWFVFEMGSRKLGWGLMWDQKAKRKDGTWDLEKVAASAYYLTPSGTKITNDQRTALVAAGKWIATNPAAPVSKRGYIYNSFILPFKNGDFGRIAAAFIDAKAKGPEQLKVFVYEYLAERFYEEKRSASDSIIIQRARDYRKGELISSCKQEISDGLTLFDIYLPKMKAVFGTFDVQKDHQWYIFREWIEGGDSGLVDYGYAPTWTTLEKLSDEYKTERNGVDYGYEERRQEVFEYALEYAAFPLKGHDKLDMPFLERQFNVLEGKRGQSKKNPENYITTYEWNTNIHRTMLLNMMRAEARQTWCVFNKEELTEEYVKQVSSTEKVDGIWQQKKGFTQDHMWDCEVMQIVMANIHGFLRVEFV